MRCLTGEKADVELTLSADSSVGVDNGDDEGAACVAELDSHVFRSLDALSDAKEGVYMYPSWRNLAAVDAVLSPATLFQMTVSTKHRIKKKGLRDVVSRLPSGDKR